MTSQPVASTGHDRGAMSVEMTALVWPVTVVMVMLLIGVWQLSATRLDVQAAAAAAARDASLRHHLTDAVDAAHTAAYAALADTGRTCSDLTLTLDTAQFTHGGQVGVQVTCHITGDLAGLSLPGAVAISATASAPIETYRHLTPESP